MLQQHEIIRDRDVVVGHPDATETLPELPEGVVVPDDLSGLDRVDRRRRSVRWLGWAAALAAVVGGAVLIATQFGDDTPAEAPTSIDVPAYDLKQQAIDDATARLERLPDVKEYYVGTYEARLDQNS
jgi:hypothetical protein